MIFNYQISEELFEKYRQLIFDMLGIHMNTTKREMVSTKINKIIRRHNIESAETLYELLLSPKLESDILDNFVDEITIHKTNFFREDNHFEFLKQNINFILDNIKRIRQNKEIRVWSSACSTGEEPYTIAMVLKECLPIDINIKILATDVSPGVITTAQKGQYSIDSSNDIKSFYLQRYLKDNGEYYEIKPDIKKLITFRTFNLMNEFPFKNKFDIIFSRNVMIYFNIETQGELIQKYYNSLIDNGILLIGHSESLTQRQYKLKYLQPTVYMK